MHFLTRSWLSLILSVAWTIIPTIASASILSFDQFTIDFTKPEEAKQKAKWTEIDVVNLNKNGLGWDGEETSSYDFWIETTQPIPLGTSWRPTSAISITAKISPPGEFKFGDKSITYPHGQMYVRYSPDAKHWSNWQHLPTQAPESKKNPQHKFVGYVRIPYREQAEYRQLIQEYSRLNVPWGSDEEAAVKWILKSDPDFFEKSIPFIGYVQFLYETSLKGGQRLGTIDFEISWGVSGMHTIPKDESVYQSRGGNWRFKAD